LKKKLEFRTPVGKKNRPAAGRPIERYEQKKIATLTIKIFVPPTPSGLFAIDNQVSNTIGPGAFRGGVVQFTYSGFDFTILQAGIFL